LRGYQGGWKLSNQRKTQTGANGQGIKEKSEGHKLIRSYTFVTLAALMGDVYFCQKDEGPNWVDICPASGVRGGCCVFRPAVQIRDNWGYCNGQCGGNTSLAGTACLDNECNAQWNPATPNAGPWTAATQTIYLTAPQRVR